MKWDKTRRSDRDPPAHSADCRRYGVRKRPRRCAPVISSHTKTRSTGLCPDGQEPASTGLGQSRLVRRAPSKMFARSFLSAQRCCSRGKTETPAELIPIYIQRPEFCCGFRLRGFRPRRRNAMRVRLTRLTHVAFPRCRREGARSLSWRKAWTARTAHFPFHWGRRAWTKVSAS